MKSSVLYRIAAVLLLLLTIGHTLEFRMIDHGGFSRTYWDLYVGMGLSMSVLFLFAAVLAWQLGGLSQETLRLMPVVTWTLAICFVSGTVLCWMYFSIVPVIFSAVISLCLILAAWLAGK